MLVIFFFYNWLGPIDLELTWLFVLVLYHDHRTSICWNDCLTVSLSFSHLLYNVSAISHWMHMEIHLCSDYSTTVGILHCQASVLSECCKLYIDREWEQGRGPFLLWRETRAWGLDVGTWRSEKLGLLIWLLITILKILCRILFFFLSSSPPGMKIIYQHALIVGTMQQQEKPAHPTKEEVVDVAVNDTFSSRPSDDHSESCLAADYSIHAPRDHISERLERQALLSHWSLSHTHTLWAYVSSWYVDLDMTVNW